MAKDVKLEQLKNAQEQAFRKKQDAYQLQQSSWGYVVDARNKANRAFDAKQAAYRSQEQAWQDYRSVCDRNGSRIDYLNSAQERAYQNMKDAFDRATSAHNSHNGAYAKAFSIEGRSYQAEAKSCVEERRQLVEECRNAKAKHEPYKQAFENAKIAYNCAKAERKKAEAIHERNETDFKRAKANFDTAEKSFQARLNELKAENANKKESNRAIADRAGIPYQYRDHVYVSSQPDGTINIYFGGVEEPTGLGHGHYAMNGNGKLIYRRDPLGSHGAQNFEDDDVCKKGGWGPRTVGTIDGFEVTFRQGYGNKEGETLIADGTPSGREFDRRKGHDHYGDKEEGGGRIEDDRGDRGKYTGPGH